MTEEQRTEKLHSLVDSLIEIVKEQDRKIDQLAMIVKDLTITISDMIKKDLK